MLTQNDVHNQSVQAWETWKQKWIKNCNITKELKKVPITEMLNRAKDKILVQCAFGYSLSLNLDELRKNQDKVEILCCDKAFGYLMENEITPTYCIIADASVGAEWMKEQDTSKTILFANVAANPEWTTAWKGPVSFFVNFDNIGTANILGKVAGVYDCIPASSNVSNAQIVLASQILNPRVQLLLGFDYSWSDDGKYYASGDSEKRHYMHHADVVSPYGYIARSSANLVFSRNWIMQFLMKFPAITAVNCSGAGYLDLEQKMPLGLAIKRYSVSHQVSALAA